MPRWLGAAATIGAAVLLVVLVILGDGPEGDRADALAARLRCPVCQSESVADSSSQTARDMRDLIEEQIATGASDEEVIDFFVATYGDWIVLDAPASGRTLILWLLPVAAAAAGGVAIAARRRRNTDTPVSPEVVGEDRSDLARQVAAGEIDAVTASTLAAVYEAEPVAPTSTETPPRLSRAVVGTMALALGVGVAVFAVVKVTDEREQGELLTGSITETPRNVDTVTNEELEAVVAANPDVIPMRLALARRYFVAGDFSAALPHYLAILDAEANPEALANVGWMAFLNNEPETAAAYLQRSLDAAPDYTQAQWFLANVRLFGLDDPAGAEPLLRAVLAADDVPPDVRSEAEVLLEEVTAS